MKKPAAPRATNTPEDESGLTSIHSPIHCGATDDTQKLDELAIDNLLQILADIALSIAKRRDQVDQ